MSTTGNCREFTTRKTVQKDHVNIIKHLIWDTLDINWPSVILKLYNADSTLSNLLTCLSWINRESEASWTIPSMLPCFLFLLFTRDTWQAPPKPNALPVQDINQSV